MTNAQLDRFIAKVAKRRDEVRALIAEIEPIFQSLESAEEDMTLAIEQLREAKSTIESAADTMSQYA